MNDTLSFPYAAHATISAPCSELIAQAGLSPTPSALFTPSFFHLTAFALPARCSDIGVRLHLMAFLFFP